MSKVMNRRVFLARAGLGVAGLALAPRTVAQMRGGGGGGMGGGGTGGVVDPPVGAPLVDPPIAPSATAPGSGVVEVTVRASVETVALDGAPAALLTYDGSFIAPTIRARRGDLVKLHFRNDLPADAGTNLLGHPRNVTNVHVHGWHVSPGDNALGVPADNVHVMVHPGAAQEYEYDLSLQRPGTLALYHPHVHGTVAEQFWGGLVGALDVEDAADSALRGIDARLLVLKDITLAAGQPAPYTSLTEYMHGKEGELVTVNAQVNPSLAMRPGEVKRLRILNASNARFYRLALQGHTLHVVGSDGGLLDRPYPVSEVLMSPGERVDLLVQAGGKGTYKLLALPYARQGSMTSPQITLLTVQVSGRRAADVLPTAVDPGAARLEGDPSMLPPPTRFALSMGHGRGYINGVSFDVLADGTIQALEHHSRVGTEEIWEIVNQSGMDHPWHQHVNDGQVIAMSGGDAAFAAYASLYTRAPAFKDTIIVPKWGSVTLRLPIRDHAGMTMFHCHILEHEDIGMMGMWHIGMMDGGMPM